MRLEHLLSGDAALYRKRIRAGAFNEAGFIKTMCNERNPLFGGIDPVSVLFLLCLLDITWEDLCGARLFFGAAICHGQSPIAQLVRAPH